MKKESVRKYFAAFIVLVLVLILLAGIYKFVNGIFGGILLFVLFLPLHMFLIKKKISRKWSAFIVVVLALFLVFIPLLVLLGLVGNEIYSLFQNLGPIENISSTIGNYVSKVFPSMNNEFINEQLLNFGGKASSFFLNTAVNFGVFAINATIAFLLLYYLLIEKDLIKRVKSIIPFNEKNSQELVNKLKDISYATVIVSGLIALIRGAVITILFLSLGIKGAFLWGFVAAILSFLPIVGPAFVWIPATIIQLFQKDYVSAIIIFVIGFVIVEYIDNIMRPVLGKKIAKIHPIITLLGVFIGISLFGMIGIFVGPLLIAFTVLVLKMFKEEYY